jgi:hypothetical protein
MNQLKKLFLEGYVDTSKTNTLFEDMMLRTYKLKNERSAQLKKLGKNKYWYFDTTLIK